jgi:hypothetical protein
MSPEQCREARKRLNWTRHELGGRRATVVHRRIQGRGDAGLPSGIRNRLVHFVDLGAPGLGSRDMLARRRVVREPGLSSSHARARRPDARHARPSRGARVRHALQRAKARPRLGRDHGAHRRRAARGSTAWPGTCIPGVILAPASYAEAAVTNRPRSSRLKCRISLCGRSFTSEGASPWKN